MNPNNIITESNNEAFMMPVYILHQEHDEDVQIALTESGSSFRKFNGKEYWNIMNQLGHTSMDFNKCTCKK